jgi:hypothetical protein
MGRSEESEVRKRYFAVITFQKLKNFWKVVLRLQSIYYNKETPRSPLN